MNLDEKFNIIKMQYEKISENLEKYKHNRLSVEYLNQQKERLDKAIESMLFDCSTDDLILEINELQIERENILNQFRNYKTFPNEYNEQLMKLNERLVYLSNIKRIKN
jgi:GTP-sensing pleiotropic transcriptional regulator CodY